MKKFILAVIILVTMGLTIKAEEKNEKNLIWQFTPSVIGGTNYFIWNGGTAYTGWGESYGWKGEVDIIFKKTNIGFGIAYGNIYETAIAKRPNTDVVWTRKLNRRGILIKLLLSPNTKMCPWIGFGKDNFSITYAGHEYDLYGVHYKIRDENLEGTERFQIIDIGVEAKIWRDVVLSGELQYGYNETHNTIQTTDFQSCQFLLGLGYRFTR